MQITPLWDALCRIVYDSWLGTLYYNVKYGVQNVVRWAPVIWHDRDWDYAYLFALMAHKFEGMERMHREDGNLADSDRTAHECMVAKALCRRVHHSNYNLSAMPSSPRSRRYSRRLSRDLDIGPLWLDDMRIGGQYVDREQTDIEYLSHLISRKARHWWD